MLVPVEYSQQLTYCYDWYTSVFSTLIKYFELVMGWAGPVTWGLVPMKDDDDFIVKQIVCNWMK